MYKLPERGGRGRGNSGNARKKTFFFLGGVPLFQFQFLPIKIKIIIWQVYVTWLYLIFMYILPFTLLAVLNLMIYM